MAKNRVKRTVSDLDAQSIESFLNGGNESSDYNSFGYESYNDPILGQEAIDILADGDTDHGTSLMRTMEALNEANMISQSIENYIAIRNLKIKMCNAFSKASKSKGYSIEAIDFWRSMEDSGKSDDTWYKNAWEAIKAFFKKIILAVINFIKTVGNFLKGALCKAQDLFYKKYAKDIRNNISKYERGKNKDIKIKVKSTGSGTLWKNAPWEVLRYVSTGLVKAYQGQQSATNAISGGDMEKASHLITELGKMVADELGKLDPATNKIVTALKTADKKMEQQAAKWFPSAKVVVDTLVYGKEKPSKNEMSVISIFKADNKTIEILSPAALTAMTFAFKTAQQANKGLMYCVKIADKMSKQDKKFESGDGKVKGKKGVDEMNKLKRLTQFNTTCLIQLYGECLSCRMKVFSAAKKLYKKGEYGEDNNNNNQSGTSNTPAPVNP